MLANAAPVTAKITQRFQCQCSSARQGTPRIEPPFGRVITEAVRTGDFEATLAWTVGLVHRAPFAVAVFHDPLRLVVDVAKMQGFLEGVLRGGRLRRT